ncbi:MAG: hypothetical protein RKU31_41880 [Deltaproteobacteria bacterium]
MSDAAFSVEPRYPSVMDDLTRDRLEELLDRRGTFFEARWRGVDFLVLDTLAFGAGEKRWDEEIGYLLVDLPRPNPCDLLLDSRREADDGAGDDLHRYFTWSATNDQLVTSQICGALLDVMLSLRERYKRVTVTDDWVGFGPIARAPSELVDDLDRVVQLALASRGEDFDAGPPGWETKGSFPTRRRSAEAQFVAPPVGWSTDSAPDGPNAEPAEGAELPFCYFCGAAMERVARVCPECGADLSDD